LSHEPNELLQQLCHQDVQGLELTADAHTSVGDSSFKTALKTHLHSVD